uniref:class A beta-lactamase n=1 Tax=uncultured bacterium TaxID=77133 RepID=UPI0001F35D4C|nr:class A beta-lactamase [uncultured bacterium]CBI71182.1 beta-lactamase class A [uncultured bacterium]
MVSLVVRSCSVAAVAVGLLFPACAAPVGATATTAPVAELDSVPQVSSGRLGVAILDFQTSKTYHINGKDRFPMQSVFKAMSAVVVMREVDEGKLTLDQEIPVGPDDISVYWSPIAEEFKGTTQTYTVRELLEKSVGMSDNTAADVLMELTGGPQAVTQLLKDAGIEGVRVDRYERQFQAELEGLPPFELGEVINRKAFVEAAKAVPAEVKRPILERYVAGKDERDTATPLGAVDFLVKLQEGKLLSAESTRVLLQIMTDVKTGAGRLKAGLPEGSKLAHKTGTGGDILGVNTATNDIGIATLPDGRKFAVAVFLTGSKESEEKRDAIHADVVRQFVDQLLAEAKE